MLILSILSSAFYHHVITTPPHHLKEPFHLSTSKTPFHSL